MIFIKYYLLVNHYYSYFVLLMSSLPNVVLDRYKTTKKKKRMNEQGIVGLERRAVVQILKFDAVEWE